jgi:hypothetical protein
MSTRNRLEIFGYISECVRMSRDPSKAADCAAVLAILQEVLQSVSNFENKLLSDLDVD